MASAALEKRLRALEQLYAERVECGCRVAETTLYHNSVELEAILQVSCAVHGFRDSGELMWVGRNLPLRREDQQFCSCPSSAVRDLLVGGRGPLTQKEHEKEEARWLREYGPTSDQEFRRDQDRIKQLLRIYEYDKSRRSE